MDVVVGLTAIVRDEVKWYNAAGLRSTTYFLEDGARQLYTVVVIPDPDFREKAQSGIVVMARVVDDYVIIDEDTTDRPLYESFMHAGIPREQIILAYAGETLPNTEPKPE